MPHCSASSVIDIDVDDDQRLVTVVIEGQASGRQVQTALCDMLRRRPEVTGYDFFYDLLSYRGDVSAGDLAAVAETYASARGADAEGTRTAFLTHDPLFGLWASAMNYQFPGRPHAAFAEAALTERFLAEPRSSRSAASPAEA